jgi:hypothetical protein
VSSSYPDAMVRRMASISQLDAWAGASQSTQTAGQCTPHPCSPPTALKLARPALTHPFPLT